MKIIETRPRDIGFVLWDHCQNLLDDPRNKRKIKEKLRVIATKLLISQLLIVLKCKTWYQIDART